ncbi:MAG: hypothetical protein EA362_12515 [Saprospirales bacterium]|nr:MAG: hypothetical protein EA362_12515 [Saprospirales bacterium]
MMFTFVNAQSDISINGITYTLFSPGLWIEVDESEGVWPTGFVHCGDPTEIVEVVNPVTGDV